MMNVSRVAAVMAVLAPFGVTGAASAADASEIEILTIVELPSDKWCRNRSGPMVTVKAVTQVQEWCDPGDRDLLQVELFAKLANGDAGDYIVSHRNYPCADATSDRVRDRLC